MAYKVLFIDEEKSQHDEFLDYMDAATGKLEVKCLFPEPNLDKMIMSIEENYPDAIITDYLLNDIKSDIKYNVNYNGVELVTQYRDIRPNFPCFVITSYDDDAVADTEDVNLVYVKLLLTKEDKNVKSKFHEKVYSQIQKYKTSIANAQKELTELLEKRASGTISLHEEQQIVDLDDFLERSLDNYQALPQEMKSLSNIKKMSSIIDKVDGLLKKIN